MQTFSARNDIFKLTFLTKPPDCSADCFLVSDIHIHTNDVNIQEVLSRERSEIIREGGLQIIGGGS